MLLMRVSLPSFEMCCLFYIASFPLGSLIVRVDRYMSRWSFIFTRYNDWEMREKVVRFRRFQGNALRKDEANVLS